MTEAKDERTFITVHDGLPDHPKVEGLSDKAFRLLVTTWCWCSRHLTDGRVPLTVWRKRATPKARRELVDVGLVELHTDYVLMHDYLEHQSSAAEVEAKKDAKRRAGRLGNHKRWHVEQNVHDPSCEFCLEDAPPDPPPGKGSQPRSQTASQNDRKTSPPSPTPTERTTHPGTGRPVSQRARPKRITTTQLAATAHSVAAHRLVEDYAATCRKRPPASVLGDLAVQVDALLGEHWTVTEIAPVVAAWGAKGLHPKLLHSVAHEVTNRATPAGYTSANDANIEALLTGGPPQLRAIPGGGSA